MLYFERSQGPFFLLHGISCGKGGKENLLVLIVYIVVLPRPCRGVLPKSNLSKTRRGAVVYRIFIIILLLLYIFYSHAYVTISHASRIVIHIQVTQIQSYRVFHRVRPNQ